MSVAPLFLTFLLIVGATYPRGPYRNVRPGEKPPAKPGAERYVSKKTGKVVYQGETSNLRDRMAKQKRDKMPYTRGNYQPQYKVPTDAHIQDPSTARSLKSSRRSHDTTSVLVVEVACQRRFWSSKARWSSLVSLISYPVPSTLA